MNNRNETADLLRKQAETIVKKAIISFFAKKAAFLLWGPFGVLVSLFAGQLAEYITKEGELRAFFLYIDLRTDSQGRAYLKAMKDYQGAKSEGDIEKLKEKEAKLNEAFKALIVLTN